jgi:GNAT superfamily N-acetyltransferase
VTTALVELVPLRHDSPADRLAAWARLYAGLLREQVPEMGLPGPREAAGLLRNDADERVEGRLAFVDGVAAGAVLVSLWLQEDRDLAYCELVVAPAYRRRGVGRALLAEATAIAAAGGRRALNADIAEASPAAAFAATTGARVTLADVRSRLAVASLDHDRLAALAGGYTGDYRLVSWGDRCPDELVDAAGAAQEAMNDRPLGDSGHEPARWDAARIRRREDRHAASGFTACVTAAVHDRTGEVAGLTEIVVPDDPVAVWQENTAVVSAHRGHRLGMAMKSANLLRLTEQWPQAEWVVTWNAADNTHMRAVNTALGFEVCEQWQEVELPVRTPAGAAASGRVASPSRP